MKKLALVCSLFFLSQISKSGDCDQIINFFSKKPLDLKEDAKFSPYQQPDIQTTRFHSLTTSSDWNLQLEDPCTDDWGRNWFLDGQYGSVENSESGMNFSAGPVNRDDAHHAVLWTNDTFAGELKIEYNYTRTDNQVINVNILYIQATGIETPPYERDILKWANLRAVPTMSKYYNNMNALHISYAAFATVNDDPNADYIRVRQYPATEEIPFSKTEIPPAFERTGLFLPWETYRITVIKTKSELYFNVKGDKLEKLFSWPLDHADLITQGRIGLRHMYTRSARYSDFKVSVR
ncbi:MAG: DUF1961 family protein [Saprospiraceae bacterium]|nr:DUF1961 family protein [Saprospiraceae bacterium]